MPRWDDFPMDYYMYAGSYPPWWSDRRGKRVFTWILSRGCPMRCNFCASGCRPRRKSLAQSISELQEIVERFNPDHITFVDNVLAVDKEGLVRICESFASSGFHFEFSAACRVDLVDRHLLAAMRRAGCRAIFYGLECANDRILRLMNKGITVEQVVEAVEMTKETGIYPMVSIMLGQPDETLGDFLKSLQISMMGVNSKDPVPNVASIMPLLTFPGTPIYEYASESGYFTSDEDYWAKYGGSHLVNYSRGKYTNEAIGQAVTIAILVSRWKYHQAQADTLLNELKTLQSSYCGSDKDRSPVDQQDVAWFLNRCLGELIS
jgi:radical SAM superfamily enzyme YgiQ (UPF0313 family)